ncbi:MAG: alpha/beta hydrolase [Clostridia bacterium]|nr:alpha/beta hydrolase [Clostridia bacterium]
MQQRFFIMPDGTRIFTEFAAQSDPKRENLLFIHGGPGSGAWEFSPVAEILAQDFNIWLPDQRGCLRSDPIPAETNFGLQTILDDLDNIRQQLQISQWIVLGHSYGGQLALAYALQNPQAVSQIVFICPSFYLLWSLEQVYRKCQDLLLQDSRTSAQTAPEYLQLLAQIPESVRRDAYYESNWQLHPTYPDFPASAQGQRQQDLLFAEGKAFENWLPYLKKLSVPALLLNGAYDPICESRQQEIFLQANPQNKLWIIPEAGHSPYNDQPELFCKLLKQFIRGEK